MNSSDAGYGSTLILKFPSPIRFMTASILLSGISSVFLKNKRKPGRRMIPNAEIINTKPFK
jgi:hypothetical protein